MFVRSFFMLALVPVICLRPVAGQNLVPNGDFELYTSCPTGLEQLDSALFWYNPTDTGTTLPGTPDYFHHCAAGTLANVPNTFIGYQQAQSGGGFAGIAIFHKNIPEYREYMAVPLTAPLIAGNCYELALFVNLGNGSRYAAGVIEAYLSDTLVSGIGNFYPLPFTPQVQLNSAGYFDTLGWQGVSTAFNAAGPATCLVIGNFKTDTLTPVVLVNPGAFGSYCYLFIEDVSLTPCVGLQDRTGTNGMRLYPNPAHLRFRIIRPASISAQAGANERIDIMNMAGEVVLARDPDPDDWIPVSGLKPGIYLVRLILEDRFLYQKLVVQ